MISAKAQLYYATIINDEDETSMIDPATQIVTKMFTCNHEEADTRMIYHIILQGLVKVVISANDTNVMFLLHMHVPLTQVMRQSKTYVDVQVIVKALKDAAFYLQSFHTLTGCDTTSYFQGEITMEPGHTISTHFQID